jgi:FAD/FMN-containing dehydrogenase
MGGDSGRLLEVIGKDNLLDDPAVLGSYARDESFASSMAPLFVARPGDEGEVQALVAWANETATPLVPVSSGPPHFYGDTVPGVPGAVVVDLSRMNKIKRIDRRNRMVVVEPGVTYAQLQPELAKEGMRVTPPLFPRANKSVVAGLLERQPTLIPRYNYTLPEPLRNCGVIWGSGERFFTGESGNSVLDLEQQWTAGSRQVDAKGPGQTDFYRLLTGAQGTLGIVTWASVRCELLADPKKAFFVPGDRLEDLLDLSYRLTRLRVGDELFLVNDAYLAALVAAEAGEIAELRERLPAWTLVIGVGGRALLAEERVAVAEKDIAAEVAGRGLQLHVELPGVTATQVERFLSGLAGEPHWKLRHKGGVRDIFFLAPLEKAPGFVETLRAGAKACRYPGEQVGVYLQPQHQGVAWHCEFSLPLDPADSEETAVTKTLFTEASAALMEQGAYFSRPYGEWAAAVYNRDAQSRKVLCTVKGFLDPNNVLNPGKLCF